MPRLTERDGNLRFQVRLTPRGGRDAIDGWAKDASGAEHLKARVAVPPEDGKANGALVALLAEALGLTKSRIRIAGGETSRIKTIVIVSAAPGTAARLLELGDSR